MKTMIKAGTDPKPTAIELANRALARNAAAEGFVLLENDGTLPLKENKIALYGSGARMTVKGGTGSGAVRERYSVTIEQGLLDAGFEIASKPWLDRFDRFYKDTYDAYCQAQEEKVKGIRDFFQILRTIDHFRHPTGIPVTAEDVEESGCDTAIYVLARQAGEGRDRKDIQGDYRLDDVERENLEFLSRAYRNFVVIVNAGGVIDVSFLDKLHVSALIYFVQGGEEGGNALADVLSGKCNFSGKLATSWAYGFEDTPSNDTYSYLGQDKYNQEYNEGIYVGYRYFDTFGVKPRYAFGYGLSYTAFEMQALETKAADGTVSVEVGVTNTGSVPGREVVQLYATVPFGIGAEKQRLVAFQKTKDLAAGERQVITLNVPAKNLACYDEAQNAWVLRSGDTILRLGNASNHTEAVARLTLSEEHILEQCEAVCPPQHEIPEIQPPVREAEDCGSLPVVSLDGTLPETRIHRYETPEEEISQQVMAMTAEQLVSLVLGAGASEEPLQVELKGASGNTTQMLWDELGIPSTVFSDGPAGLNMTPEIVVLPDGEIKAVYNDRNLEAYRKYMFGVNKIGLRRKMADPSEGTVHYQFATAWPCSQLLAQSFDPELLEQVGDAVGKEMEAFGVTVWLAPGMNLHRNPLCGRTFEYYSEDPYVSGKMAAAIVRGVQKHPGKGMSIKHFAANNCELERNFSSSNMSQRTLRELYLRGFEIAIGESDPMTVMASYNKINGIYATNNYDLLVKVLRNEWGYRGLVMSDWHAMKCQPGDPFTPLSSDVQKCHAAQCDLVMPGRPDQKEALLAGIAHGSVKIEDLRRSAMRILKVIRSNTALKCE